MRKFSDIPEFILDEYLDQILSTNVNNPSYTSSIDWQQILFSDLYDVVINEMENGFLYSYLYNGTDPNTYTTNSYLIYPRGLIVSKGGNLIETFVETETNYQKVDLIPRSNQKEDDDWVGTYYNFKISDEVFPNLSDEIKYQLEDDYYNFIRYKAFENGEQNIVNTKTGFDVYLRSDSLFHDWGEENYPDYSNYNKDFLFLGKMFPYLNEEFSCRIFRYLFYDYVINSLPTNNRTEKLNEFIKVAFDQVYHHIYNKQRELKSLYDANEMDIVYSEQHANQFNIDLSLFDLEQDKRVRDLIINLPVLLKKKGTYSSLISIWKIISGFKEEYIRNINIYEWWHDALPEGRYIVEDDEWEEINYLNVYSEDVEHLLNPSYYSRYTETYPDFYKANIYAENNDTHIHKQETESTIWTVNHWLNEEQLVVQCFNDVYEEISPKKITINDNSEVIIEFNKPTKGFCALSRVQFGRMSKGSFWEITHYINKKYIINQTFNEFNERFFPKNVFTVNYDNVEISNTSSRKGYGYFVEGDYIYYHLNDLSTWEINHDLNALILTQVFDIDDNKIIPKNIKNEGLNTLRINFSKPTSGYVIIKVIGQVRVDLTQGKILSPHYKVECDLSHSPCDKEAIIKKSTAENLYTLFEDFRPVNRVAHYHMVFAPRTNFSGIGIGAYDKKYDAKWVTSFVPGRLYDNTSIHSQNDSKEKWNIRHNLKTDQVLVFVFDKDYNEIIPSNISIQDWMNIEISFDTEVDGYAVIIESESYERHTFDKTVIGQFYTIDLKESIFPAEIVSRKNFLYGEDTDEKVCFVIEGNVLWEQKELEEKWDINHNLKTNSVIAQFYDNEWNRIIPDTFTLTDTNNCEVTFSEPISGYGVIKPVGNIELVDDTIESILENGVNIKLGDSYNEDEDGVQNMIHSFFINNENIYMYGTDMLCIDIDLDEDDEYDIREVAIHDSEDKQLYFYSYGDQLYKDPNYTMTIHFKIEKVSITY